MTAALLRLTTAHPVICVVSCQIENVKTGKPYIMFGDGQLASCKPISESDLASFMADCIEKKELANQMLPIGGER